MKQECICQRGRAARVQAVESRHHLTEGDSLPDRKPVNLMTWCSAGLMWSNFLVSHNIAAFWTVGISVSRPLLVTHGAIWLALWNDAFITEHKWCAVVAVCFDADELDSKRMSLTTKSRYSLAENSLKTCEDLVTELMRQDDAWPFHKPVTKKEVNV